MKILIVGGGGREHALAEKISQSPLTEKIYCAPGNGGISQIATCVDIQATDIESMVNFAVEEKIDLVVVAQDDPLVLGMVDRLEERSVSAFGPNKAAAIIEGSKVFSKNLMKKYNIPTSKYEVFDNLENATEYLKNSDYPIVIKAEGLAYGKGVIIAESFDEAKGALGDIMEKRIFKSAGERVVIEQFLSGKEVSVLAFTDGKTIVPMVSAQDHKKLYDGDKGLNTGGMGAFSPSDAYTKETAAYCMEKIFLPTMNAMNSEGRKFKGVLYFGLIITETGVYVIEYNCRFGDPEAQVVLPRLKSDIIEIIKAIMNERLCDIKIEWSDKAAACVIMASEGYPKQYRVNYKIDGMDKALSHDGVSIYHSGTKKIKDDFYTNGGRVLGITATGDTMGEAVDKAYNAVAEISFEGAYHRTDIGKNTA
ncbi:MAG: phosphoribosylamine--glycine ligase [Firmicutes bacterium]|nr:phosphoribosylamine--glycine ligase [Bacillota bacterium]